MLRLSFCALLLLAACTQTPAAPCAEGCISTLVEWEPGYAPCSTGCISTMVEWEPGYGPASR